MPEHHPPQRVRELRISEHVALTQEIAETERAVAMLQAEKERIGGLLTANRGLTKQFHELDEKVGRRREHLERLRADLAKLETKNQPGA